LYLAQSEGLLGLGGNNFAELHAPANIKAFAEAGSEKTLPMPSALARQATLLK
jgi:hypothetical protein